MSAQSAEPVPDPLDPQQIVAGLPGSERSFFLDQYREAAERAREPAGWKELHRLLRLWRFHADEARKPGYRESREAARRPVSESGGMFLDDVIRLRERGE